MRFGFRRVSAEVYLAGAVVLSVGAAGLLSLAGARFAHAAVALIAADLVLYGLTKLRLLKLPVGRNGSS